MVVSKGEEMVSGAEGGSDVGRLHRWKTPATRIRLARRQDVEAAYALMATAGRGVRIISVLATAIEDGSASSAMPACPRVSCGRSCGASCTSSR
jgi:hypothetical protein